MTAILAFLIDTKLGRGIAITGIVVIAITASWLTFKTHYYNQGWAAAVHAVALQDQKAVADAKNAKDEVAACFAAGKSWNVDDGVCE
jgi:hypothetical protein